MSVKLALWTVVFLLTTVFVSLTAEATFPGTNGKIAFQRGGNIWVMNPNGTGQIRLTSTGTAANPQWSADGRKIAYDQRSLGSNKDLWVMDGNGSHKYRVTAHVKDESDPAWSPNGVWLAFETNRNDRGEIFKIRSSAPFGRAIRLTRTASTGIPHPTPEDPYLSDFQANWSPAGNRIAFSRYIRSDDASSFGYSIELMTIHPDGSGIVAAHRGNGLGETCPVWSPGGRRIAWVDDEFVFTDGNESSNVWHSNPDGSDQRQVTHFASQTPWHLGCLSWSPERGKAIVFSGFKDDFDPARRPSIYRVPANGLSGPTLIASNGANPDWGRVIST